MAPRKRSPGKRDFPDNTYESGGYYRWRHPETRKEYGLGSDRTKAFKEAKRANLHLAMQHPPLSLVERISGKAESWGDWMDLFEKLLGKRTLAKNTRNAYASLAKKARALVEDDAPFASVTTKVIADALGKLTDEGKARTAQSFRSFLKDMFAEAIANGRTTENPALVTRTITAEVRRARLQFDIFMRVYEAEQLPWAKNCYALAIVSGQDRESCAHATFKDIRENAWWNERGKTGARIVLPLELKLDCFGMSLGDAVKQCRSTGVLSKHLIHHVRKPPNGSRGDPLALGTISGRFTDTLATLGIDWGDKSPPTFHEIRSLSERLYRKQGNVNPQELLGHKSAKMTEKYDDPRGEWVRVSITG